MAVYISDCDDKDDDKDSEDIMSDSDRKNIDHVSKKWRFILAAVGAIGMVKIKNIIIQVVMLKMVIVKFQKWREFIGNCGGDSNSDNNDEYIDNKN